MFPLEAALTVTLGVEDGRVARVAIASTRSPQAARLLAGRAPAQATQLLSTVFSLCGTAQTLAALAAIEAAAGTAVSPDHHTARRQMLRAETVAEHLLGMARDWPEVLGEAPDLSAVKPLRPAVAACRKALYPDGDWHRPGGGRLAPDEAALESVSGTLKSAADHVLPGIAARLLRRVADAGLTEFGASPVPLMPPDAAGRLGERLAADADFAALPDLDGTVHETGPLARHPMGGNGLLARLQARGAEVNALLLSPPPLKAEEGWGGGLGAVEAARGLLLHHVRLDAGTIADFRILAPTEWNLHPNGPLALGLVGTAADEGLEWRARLLCLALDPCVACRIRVE
jgi:coenzyme F420-reducing hydrogenase alpha subunit